MKPADDRRIDARGVAGVARRLCHGLAVDRADRCPLCGRSMRDDTGVAFVLGTAVHGACAHAARGA